MRKVMIAGLAVAVAMGSCFTASAAATDREPVQVVAEGAVMSAYVWRGMVLNDGAVFQPQLTLAQYGFSFNIWGNYDISHNVQDVHKDFSEIDISLAYAIPLSIDEVSLDVGFIKYLYPNMDDVDETEEIFGKLTFNSLPVIVPSVTLFGDCGEAKGFYTLLEVVVPLEISDALTVEGGASAGYGSSPYCDYYWGDNGHGFTDYNVFASVSYKLMERVSLSVNATYTRVDGSVDTGADDLYEDDSIFWGGVNLAYEF